MTKVPPSMFKSKRLYLICLKSERKQRSSLHHNGINKPRGVIHLPPASSHHSQPANIEIFQLDLTQCRAAAAHHTCVHIKLIEELKPPLHELSLVLNAHLVKEALNRVIFDNVCFCYVCFLTITTIIIRVLS